MLNPFKMVLPLKNHLLNNDNNNEAHLIYQLQLWQSFTNNPPFGMASRNPVIFWIMLEHIKRQQILIQLLQLQWPNICRFNTSTSCPPNPPVEGSGFKTQPMQPTCGLHFSKVLPPQLLIKNIHLEVTLDWAVS